VEVQSLSRRGAVLNFREVYLELKRQDNLSSGMTEREAEQNIQAYLEWCDRREEWEEATRLPHPVTCTSCAKASTYVMTRSGAVCRVCYMTKSRCAHEGCNRLVSGRRITCVEHYQEVQEGTNVTCEKAMESEGAKG
jgi:hypothetical protein